MPADASIFGLLKPPAPQPGPLDNYTQMMSVRQLMDNSDLHAMQRTKFARDMKQEEDFRNLFSGATPESLNSPEFQARALAADPARAMALRKNMTEEEKARLDMAEKKVKIANEKATFHRNALAGVTDQPGYEAAVKSGIEDGQQWAKQAPPQYDQGWVRQHVMDADKFIAQTTPKFEKVDQGGKVVMVDVNPVTNPAIGKTQFAKTMTPDAVASNSVARANLGIHAATADPLNLLGLRDVAARAGGGGSPAGTVSVADVAQGRVPAPNALVQPSVGAPAPVAAAAPAKAPAVDMSLTGDEFLRQLPPGVQSQVKALAEGRLALSNVRSNPVAQQLIQLTGQYDPNFDAVNYNSRNATRKDFTAGQSSKSLNALNTVMGHLDELDKAGTALDNSGIPYWNKLANWAGSQVNPELKGRVNQFNLARQAVSSEMERAYRGTGGNVTEIEAWKKTLDDADSPQAIRASIQMGVKLLESKIQALGETYSKGMGTTKSGMELLDPKARATFDRLVKPEGDKRDDLGGKRSGAGKTGGIKFLGWVE